MYFQRSVRRSTNSRYLESNVYVPVLLLVMNVFPINSFFFILHLFINSQFWKSKVITVIISLLISFKQIVLK